MRGNAVHNDYLVIKLKDNTYRKYILDSVKVSVDYDDSFACLVVRDVEGAQELMFAAPLENVEYWERKEEITNGN